MLRRQLECMWEYAKVPVCSGFLVPLRSLHFHVHKWCVITDTWSVQQHGQVGCVFECRGRRNWFIPLWWGIFDCFCWGDASYREKDIVLDLVDFNTLLLNENSQSLRLTLKQQIQNLIGFESLLHKGSFSYSLVDPMLQRNELWGKNPPGLIAQS